MKVSLNVIKKRVEALEQTAALRHGGDSTAELLSPRDATFLVTEYYSLKGQDTVESALLAARINDLLKSHERAMRRCSYKKMTPKNAAEALQAASERTPEEDEQYCRDWRRRLEATP